MNVGLALHLLSISQQVQVVGQFTFTVPHYLCAFMSPPEPVWTRLRLNPHFLVVLACSIGK